METLRTPGCEVTHVRRVPRGRARTGLITQTIAPKLALQTLVRGQVTPMGDLSRRNFLKATTAAAVVLSRGASAYSPQASDGTWQPFALNAVRLGPGVFQVLVVFFFWFFVSFCVVCFFFFF